MKKTLDRCTQELENALYSFPWNDRQAYGDWLVQTYFYVRHSTRLLAAASARFGHDEVSDALHYRFATHIGEEKRHERLALTDLQRLGLRVENYEERHTTRLLYETQYYKIEHEAPAVLFGYILPLEAGGPRCGKRICEQVTAAFGPKCDTFLRVHADEDEEHLEKALKQLEAIRPEEQALIARNIEQTTYAYCAILRDITERPRTAAR